ncbi:MAG: TetR/AcrR family transcriptional regulator [Bacteroidetes bacterium]|nr:TetR/AcrR family transcriptional regulator [Bacteroidota bacterium]
MTTKEQILRIGDELIRDKGINAFSFTDISGKLGIKNASVHYHFATKDALVLAVINRHIEKVTQLRERNAAKDPTFQLQAFISTYAVVKKENKICLVGSLASDLNTVNKTIRKKLTELADLILDWVTEILETGKSTGVFHFNTKTRTKALLVITAMLASVQLSRLTGDTDFKRIKESIIQELTTTL